jgi:hypothetical protein
MTPREERGLIIAATSRLNRNDDGTWRVLSQTSKEAVFYTVDLETKSCTCPDCQVPLTCLIQEQETLGIAAPVFWPSDTRALQGIAAG